MFWRVKEGNFWGIVKHNRNNVIVNLLQEAYKALDSHDMDVLRRKRPNANEGFMWTRDPELMAIMDKIDAQSTDGHSGASLAITMRHMQYIAMHGWNDYVRMRRVCACKGLLDDAFKYVFTTNTLGIIFVTCLCVADLSRSVQRHNILQNVKLRMLSCA